MNILETSLACAFHRNILPLVEAVYDRDWRLLCNIMYSIGLRMRPGYKTVHFIVLVANDTCASAPRKKLEYFCNKRAGGRRRSGIDRKAHLEA